MSDLRAKFVANLIQLLSQTVSGWWGKDSMIIIMLDLSIKRPPRLKEDTNELDQYKHPQITAALADTRESVFASVWGVWSERGIKSESTAPTFSEIGGELGEKDALEVGRSETGTTRKRLKKTSNAPRIEEIRQELSSE
ncbi:hypothetical protein DFH08DRAFT_820298 [Mycena albidolilacea]|uniref:Uncharacterized protein n=1 Tax=Mycena albidolilacea TaxID=1033008 RepID=A0AAD7EEA8_9AGAR|nr:hypothetical protein DFH08DRAFT_820298 [Mycena albidolilacea]